ncbi:MAG TPA: hypothetical protein V6C91_13845, partial [Coleofasciculaceae cyanobacterium]
VSLSHSLDRKVRLRLITSPNQLQIPDGFTDIFLYNPARTLRNELNHNYKVELVPINSEEQNDKLWRLKKR